MDQEGDKESSLCAEGVATLSPCIGKRLRNDKEGGDLLLTADEGAKVRGSDSFKEPAAAGVDGIGEEDQATENLSILQSGKRTKCDPHSIHHEIDAENIITPEKGKTVSECFVASSEFNKAQALTSEVEAGNQFYCSICIVKCTSAKDHDTHLAGKRHARALKGVVTPHSGKVTTKPASGTIAKPSPSKTAAFHEDGSTKEQAIVDGSNTSFDQAGKGLLPRCTDCTSMEVADLQAFQCPDVSLEEPHIKEGTVMETLGSQVMKNDTTNKTALHGNGNGKFFEPLINGNTLEALVGGLAKCNNNMEGQHNRSMVEIARCKSNSDCIARALAAAYQACPCPGLEGLLKSGAHDQAATDAGSSNPTGGMVSMHTPCFMNLLHNVQVKVMEDLFLHLVRDERVRGLSTEAWLPNGAPVPPLPPCAEDLKCTVCRVEYGSKSDLDRHVTGKKHTSLVTRLHSKCLVCNINCNSEKELEKHVSGKKHGSKLRLVQKRVAF